MGSGGDGLIGHVCHSCMEACPLPDKTTLSVADAFFQHIVCRFGMPMVIHSDQWSGIRE